MDAHVERLAAEALTLPIADRAELAHRLIQSLDEAEQAEAAVAGHAEALRRLDEIDRGVVQPISADELFARVRRRVAK
jgi:putative addiction module component (TIGR02574 family)